LLLFSLATLAVFGYERARTALALLVVPMSPPHFGCWALQAFVLHAYCQYCLLSAATTLTLTLLAVVARFVLPASATTPGQG
jgi:uncharacterized membrane protein